MDRLKQILAELKKKPWVAHLLRMQDRYTTRLGNQFAGAITYFSVLALVPVLMFVFAGLGFTLTVLRPDLLQQVVDMITEQLGGLGPQLGEQIGGLIEDFLRNWRAVGVVGLLSAIYSASGWAGQLRAAIRAQTRPDFDMSDKGPNFVLARVVNLVLLLGLLVFIVLTFALANISTTLTGWIIGVLGLEGVPAIGFLVRFVGPIASGVAGWGLFLYTLTVFPQRRFPFRSKAWAALIGSVGLAVLQYATSFLGSSFTGNPAAALFGPVIVLMLFFNLFARLILYVAAWMATAVQQANPAVLQDFDEPLAEVESSAVSVEDVEVARARRSRQQEAALDSEEEDRSLAQKLRAASGLPVGGAFDPEQHRPDREYASAGDAGAPPPAGPAMAAATDGPASPAPATVSRRSALATARASMRVGWLTGAVAGMGLGAVLAAVTGFATRFMPGARDRD